jgi:hypothetical protein
MYFCLRNRLFVSGVHDRDRERRLWSGGRGHRLLGGGRGYIPLSFSQYKPAIVDTPNRDARFGKIQ